MPSRLRSQLISGFQLVKVWCVELP